MRIDIELDDRRARDAMRRLADAGRDMTPAMKAIGEHLVNSTKERFEHEKAPDGTPWAPLSEVTRKRKKRNPDRIGTESGILGSLIHREAGPDFVRIGSSRVYAGTFHHGAAKGAFGSYPTGLAGRDFDVPIPWGDIPARPFVGLSGEDRDVIERDMVDWLRQQVR